MSRIFLSLGSNLGDRRACIEKAVAMLTRRVGKLRRRSALYETEPWADTPGDDFLNLVVEMTTEMEPLSLLEALHAIEAACGRRPETVRYAPRELDIDILFYGTEVLVFPNLVIPHPALQDRRFVLVPMREIAPRWKHPVLGTTMAGLLRRCTDSKQVQIFV